MKRTHDFWDPEEALISFYSGWGSLINTFKPKRAILYSHATPRSKIPFVRTLGTHGMKFKV